MLFIKSRSRREKRKRLLKNVSAVVAVIFSFSLVSYLFLSGFNRLEAILGWKNNVIVGFMSGLMAAWILWDRLSLGVYVFLLVSLLTAFFINFGTVIGLSVLFLVFVEGGIVWWRQADAAKRKKFKRRLPWIFYR